MTTAIAFLLAIAKWGALLYVVLVCLAATWFTFLVWTDRHRNRRCHLCTDQINQRYGVTGIPGVYCLLCATTLLARRAELESRIRPKVEP